MPTNPYDAIKALLSNGSLQNASNPNGFVQGRLQSEERLREMKRNRELASQPVGPDTTQYSFGGPKVHAPSFSTGATASDIEDVQSDLDTDPFAGKAEQARVAGINKANDAAISQGFGGSTDFATHQNPKTGMTDEIMQVPGSGDGQSPSQRMAAAGRQSELTKLLSPLEVEKQKGKNALAENSQLYDLITMTAKGSGINTPVPSHAPGTNMPNVTPTNQPPARSQSWMEFLKGTGSQPYSGLGDLIGAASERAKYAVFPTPGTDYTQQASLGNLEQLAAMFPGNRGVQALMGKLSEHQANVGKETPSNTYLRLHGLNHMLDQMEQEMDSTPKVKIGPGGRMESATPNQMVQRGKLAIADTKQKFNEALAAMERQYPGINRILENNGGVPSAQTPGTPGSSRFERIE